VRHPVRAALGIAAVAATLALAGCSAAPAAPADDYKGEPHGVQAPARSAGGAEYAMWLDKGDRFAITLYGSSSCAPIADTMRVTGSNKVKVTLKPTPKGACTADYAPHTSVFETPSAIRIGTNVTIVVVRTHGAQGGHSDDTTITLPGIRS
jgi:hypothetical protein